MNSKAQTTEQKQHTVQIVTVIMTIITTTCSTLLVAVIVPWGTWVTGQIYELNRKQTTQQTWQDSAPRYTEKDAALGRAQQESNWNSKVEEKLDRIHSLIQEHMLKDKP